MNQLVTGKFIALKRKQKNLTQEQLAEKLGVSNKTTDLYRLYNTNIHEKIAEQKKKEAMLQ